MKKFIIKIIFKGGGYNCRRAWTGEDIAADNDCAVYMFTAAELAEEMEKARDAVRGVPWATVEAEEITEE